MNTVKVRLRKVRLGYVSQNIGSLRRRGFKYQVSGAGFFFESPAVLVQVEHDGARGRRLQVQQHQGQRDCVRRPAQQEALHQGVGLLEVHPAQELPHQAGTWTRMQTIVNNTFRPIPK